MIDSNNDAANCLNSHQRLLPRRALKCLVTSLRRHSHPHPAATTILLAGTTTMRIHHALLTLTLISPLCSVATAQSRTPPGWSVPMLPIEQISEYIRGVFQDRDGYMWFGTNGDGVVRLNGTTLEYYNIKEGLGGSAIRGIEQTADGAMWFATEFGVSRFHEGLFTNYTMAEGLSHHEVWCMMLDKSGVIWVGTQAGACRFDGKAFVPFPIPRAQVENPEPRFDPRLVWSIYEDRDGAMWFSTDGEGLRKFDGKTFTTYTTKDGLVSNETRGIFGDGQGRIWIGSDDDGLSCFDCTTFQKFTTENGLSSNRAGPMLEDNDGNLWFSALGVGATRYDGTTFTTFGVEQGLISLNPLSEITNIYVQDMFQDKDGMIWVGCSGGLFRYDGTTFTNITREGPWR